MGGVKQKQMCDKAKQLEWRGNKKKRNRNTNKRKNDKTRKKSDNKTKKKKQMRKTRSTI